MFLPVLGIPHPAVDTRDAALYMVGLVAISLDCTGTDVD
jgi:hypothetical protein